MKSRSTHTIEILRDDVRWLENRIQQLLICETTHERRLASCYRTLLRQRRRQLVFGAGRDGACPGCWNDYFC